MTCRDKCTAQVSPLPTAFQRQAAANSSSDEAETIIKFNSAYNIATEELPFTKFKSEMILQKKNGLNRVHGIPDRRRHRYRHKGTRVVYCPIFRRGRPVNILIGHAEVEHAHAQGIDAASKKAFAALGDQCSNWLEKIIALGADGAAVNLGSRGVS
ncbi:hypothetical protein SRHO_G00333940 [Serrasalmus rhombeus]